MAVVPVGSQPENACVLLGVERDGLPGFGGEGRGIVVAENAKLTPSTRLAVLGLLLEEPSWGYKLTLRFERIFGDAPWEWRVTPQAIYNALRSLEGAGMIEPIDIEADDDRWGDSTQGRMRQPYRVTGAGARSMREWLATPMASRPSQEEVLLRVHFGEARDEALRTMLNRHLEVCLLELERIAAAPATTRMQRLMKEDRRLVVQARLSWIDYARAELRAPADARVRPVEP